jgi:hypothetical protein
LSLDHLQRSRGEARGFNIAWLKRGEELSWVQRVGFAILSLAYLAVGALLVGMAVASLVHEDEFLYVALESCGVVLGTLVFLVPGVLGLRNVLRFPKA